MSSALPRPVTVNLVFPHWITLMGICCILWISPETETSLNTVSCTLRKEKGKWEWLLLLTASLSNSSLVNQWLILPSGESLKTWTVLNHLRDCYVEFSYTPRASTMTSHNLLCQFVSQCLSVKQFEATSSCLWETKWLLCEVGISTVKEAIIQLKGQYSIPWSVNQLQRHQRKVSLATVAITGIH